MNPQLQHAIAAIKSGDKATGQQLLVEVLKAEPRNVEAWWYFAEAQEEPSKRIDCLERLLDLAPYNERATRALGLPRIDMGSGPGYVVAGLVAVLLGLGAWLFVSQATLGVAILAGACLCGIMARLAQADHHQKNLLRMMSRIRKR